MRLIDPSEVIHDGQKGAPDATRHFKGLLSGSETHEIILRRPQLERMQSLLETFCRLDFIFTLPQISTALDIIATKGNMQISDLDLTSTKRIVIQFATIAEDLQCMLEALM